MAKQVILREFGECDVCNCQNKKTVIIGFFFKTDISEDMLVKYLCLKCLKKGIKVHDKHEKTMIFEDDELLTKTKGESK